MGHPQPPTPVATDTYAENSIVSGIYKQKISRATNMQFYRVSDRVRQKHFRILWEEVKKIVAGYFTNHPPIW